MPLNTGVIRTTDIFQAAYILSLCDSAVAVRKEGNERPVYVLTGKGVFEPMRLYKEGLAFISLESFRVAFADLLEQSGQDIQAKPD
jgi:hypothetical protein